MDLNKFLSDLKTRHGFMSREEVRQLADLDRMRQVLVRCGNGRFVTSAQNVLWFVDIVEREGTDYIRDIALLADDPIFNK